MARVLTWTNVLPSFAGVGGGGGGRNLLYTVIKRPCFLTSVGLLNCVFLAQQNTVSFTEYTEMK